MVMDRLFLEKKLIDFFKKDFSVIGPSFSSWKTCCHLKTAKKTHGCRQNQSDYFGIFWNGFGLKIINEKDNDYDICYKHILSQWHSPKIRSGQWL